MHATTRWFGPEDDQAVRDVWHPHESLELQSAVADALRGDTSVTGELASVLGRRAVENHRPAFMRAVFQGKWAEYEATLRDTARVCAAFGFTNWKKITKAVAGRITPVLVATHHDDPARLSAALRVMHELIDRVRTAMEEGYVDHFRLITQMTSEGVWMLDDRDRTTFINQHAADMLGYAPAEVIGRDVFAFLTDRRRPPHGRSEVELRRKDGTTFAALVEATPILGRDGEHRGLLAMVRDMSALRESQARFQKLADSGIVGLCIGTHRGGVIEANDEYLRIVGRTREEIEDPSFTWRDVLTPEWRAQIESFTREVSAVGAASMRETQLLRKDGTRVPVLIGVANIDSEHAMAFVTDLTERKRTENELRESENLYRALFENSPLPKWLYDARTLRFLVVNDAAVKQYGWTREEMLEMTLLDIRTPEERERVRDSLFEERTGTITGIGKHQCKDGTVFDVEVTAHFLPGGQQVLVTARDVSEQQRLEEQLRQAQKMEAIGALAGGVAHDFNNLLTVILGYTGLLAQSLPPGSDLFEDISAIDGAGRRAAELTRQLLAFSRQQVLQPRVMRVPAIIEGMNKMLVRLLGETIMLRTSSSSELRVLVDPGQLEQIVMNLAVNARDAMPDGGTLSIDVDDVVVDAALARTRGLSAGVHVRLRIRDSGTGMDRATQARIFEPFFTTKPKGKGTGLGLSTVFGIVKQSGGAIAVESAVGQGTTFEVWFPTTDRPTSDLESALAFKPSSGNETILLVEDDEQVRVLARQILTRNGYRVLEAASGGDALVVAEQFGEPIHLLLTDVVMPHMGGRPLAERLAPSRPGMRVLYMSGYSDDSTLRWSPRESGEAHFAFLQKPLTPTGLAMKVREVLDGTDAE